MCGINGGYNIDRPILESMVTATAHRGPDATGFKSIGPVQLGHNRLAIIDTDVRSNQPMSSPDGRHHLVFNGEIYNFKELRSLVPGWNFKTTGDTEVLLALLATKGTEILNQIHGIFVFAWYDNVSGFLTLVRDQMGVKPLYYCRTNSSLLFSSELSGILASNKVHQLDHEALNHYFSFNFVPSPQSLVGDVKKVPPGHLLTFNGTDLAFQKYYTPIKPIRSHLSHSEIRTTVGDTITQQLVSDRPVGVLLSGGFDSSIVLHHVSERQKASTFTTSFEMVPGQEIFFKRFNADAILAAKTAKFYGAEHTEVHISLREVRSNLLSSLEKLDEPVPNPVTAFQMLLCRVVREKGIVVALGGDGGDELWGGYDRHRAVLAAQYYQSLPLVVQRLGAAIHSRLDKLRVPVGVPLHKKLTMVREKKFKKVLRQPIDNHLSVNLLHEYYQLPEYQGLSPIDAFMRIDRALWLANDALHRIDRASMAVGVEARVPMLGLPIITLADSMYSESKFNPFSGKALLKAAYKDSLPRHLYTEPKRGWMAPGAMWLSDPVLGHKIKEVLSQQYYDGLSQLIDWPAVQAMHDAHANGKGYHLHVLWSILSLQVWARRYKITF